TSGRLNIYAGGQMLVGSTVSTLTFTASGAVTADSVYPATLSGVSVNGRDVTSSLSGGELGALIALRDEPSCALTHASTADNADHLSAGFVEALRALYGGTRRAAQELDGQIVELDGALFTAEMMQRARMQPVDQALPYPLGGEGGPKGRMRGLPASGSSSDGQPADTAPSSERLRR
ncbi:MAG: terminase large subunit domain-containing protein, partial [Hyphomonas sp.]